MPTAYETALAFVLEREGGYANHPNDPGGATMKGVTQAVYDAWRRARGLPAAPVRRIADAELAAIYQANYWRDARCPHFSHVRPKLALVHFDAAVNMGVVQAARCLQRALGVDADGVLGPVTCAAACACDEAATITRYLEDRARVYRAIVARRPASRGFLYGWLARLRHCARATGTPITAAFARPPRPATPAAPSPTPA